MLSPNDLFKQELLVLRKDIEDQMVRLYQDIAVHLKNLVQNIATDINGLDDRLTLLENQIELLKSIQPKLREKDTEGREL